VAENHHSWLRSANLPLSTPDVVDSVLETKDLEFESLAIFGMAVAILLSDFYADITERLRVEEVGYEK
jgi:hypothetical protein